MSRLSFLALVLVLAACGVSSHATDLDDGETSGPEADDGKHDDGSSSDGDGPSEDAIRPPSDDFMGADTPSEDAPDEGMAGSGGAAHVDPDRTLTYYADAKPIIDAKCTACHFDGGIAPMPLTTFDEVEPFLELIDNDVAQEVMPPWTANVPYDYFLDDRRLKPEQKETLLAWIEQGAQEGDPQDEPESTIERTVRSLERIDLTLQSNEAFTPDIEPDDYRCFVIEWPYDTIKYITGIDIVPDKRAMVHHAIVYHVQPEDAQAARDRDAGEAGPGYTCFGSAGGAPSWLQSYEPGGYAQGIPGNLGFEVRPGSVMVLQVHYNTLNGVEPDRSWVDMTIEDSVPNVGKVVLIMQPGWPAGGMPIPAGQADVPFAFTGRSASLAADRRYGLYWVDLHMHQLGRNGRIGIIRAGHPEQVEILLDIPDWKFEWQETYMLREPNVLEPGDQLYVECHFDNTAENQGVVNGERLPPRDVNWGDGTTDEMCLGNVLAAPLN